MSLRYRHIRLNSNPSWNQNNQKVESTEWEQYRSVGWECPEGWRVFQISEDGHTIILESCPTLSYRDHPGTDFVHDRINELEDALIKIISLGSDPTPGDTLLIAKKAFHAGRS